MAIIDNTDLTFDEWKEKYKPIMEGDYVRIFETYGSDLDILRLLPSENIWTAVDEWREDWSKTAIVTGMRLVDRLYYIVTMKKWETRAIIVGMLGEEYDA